MTNSADPDQKPTNLDLHCLQSQIYPGSAGQGYVIETPKIVYVSYIIKPKTFGREILIIHLRELAVYPKADKIQFSVAYYCVRCQTTNPK